MARAEYARKYYARNRAKICQQMRDRRQANLEDFNRKQRAIRARARAKYLTSIAPSLTCQRPGCAFVPEDLCQLQVDHINGNHHDNRAENLQVLCSNCHDLKTKLAGENNWRRLKGV